MRQAPPRGPASKTDFRAQLEASPLASSGPAWLRERRRRAMERHLDLGLPSTKLESWRTTNVAPIARTEFVPSPSAPAPEAVDLEHLAPGPSAARLVFVDGRYAPELSSPLEGVAVELSRALGSHEDALEPRLGALIGEGADDAFGALNTALFQDGAWIRLAAGTELTDPIQLVFLGRASSTPVASHPRVVLTAERGARATVIETWASLEAGTRLTNAALELELGPGAAIDHVKTVSEAPQAFHLSLTRARLERDAQLRSHLFSLGGGLVRNHLAVELAGEGAHATLGGLYVVDGKELADCQTFVDHAVPHAGSDQVYHGVLHGAGRAAFGGRVLVREGALGTTAHQQNKNLILSDQALADTKPQLEILADDVSCSHGATIGRLEEEAVFYLRSRGIGETAARSLLTQAFANVVVTGLRHQPLVEHLRAALARRFGA